MGSLVINSSLDVDASDLEAAVGEGFSLRQAPLKSRRLSGEEVAVSFAVSIAANVAYAAIQEGVRSIAKWISSRAKAKGPSVTLTLIGNGTRLSVTHETSEKEIEVFIQIWTEAQQNDE